MEFDRLALGSLIFNTNKSFSRYERLLPCNKASLYSGQPRILTVLKDNEGCTLKELSNKCNIGMPSLSVSVRNMEKMGLLEKGPGLRNQQIFLTEEGHKRVQLFHEEIDGFFKSFVSAVGEDKAQQLLDRLQDFYGYIEDYMQNELGTEVFDD